MTQHEINGKIVGFVEVDEQATGFEILVNCLLWDNRETGSYDDCVELPEGNWQILSLHSEMTEEKARELGLSLEQYHSLVKSLGLVTENPIPEPEFQCDEYGKGGYCEVWVKEFEEAQRLVKNYLLIYKEK